MKFSPNDLPDLKGKVYLVTGGNSGIGYYTVSHLAQHGAHVYMGVRSLSKGKTAVSNIQKLYPSAKIDLLQMDNTNLSSVVSAAKHFLTLESSLHGLVNNAGIMAAPHEITKDEHEIQWQTNYLAHWVLTEHLLPLLRKTAEDKNLPAGSVRIVNITSSGHLSAPKYGINFDNTGLKEEGAWARYGQSKLGNILHSKSLNKKYGPGSNNKGEIWTSSVHPGVVETNLVDSVEPSRTVDWVIWLMRALGLVWPTDKGSWNTLYCAASSDMKAKQSGTYMEIFGRWGEPFWQSSAAKDEKLADKLDSWTRELMKKEGWVE